MKPHISVVIPAFNEEDYLPTTLEAINKQDFKGQKEIIVVDNNSTDKTTSIAESYNARVISEKQQGIIFAKQAGCKSSQGNIIAVLDADNIPPHHWLSTISDILKDSKLAAVTGPYIIHNAPWWATLHTKLGVFFINFIQSITGNSPHVWGGNVAFKRKVFEKIGGYDTRFTCAGDEIQIRRDLQKLGRVRHETKLAITTSTRRFKKGFFYFYFQFLLKDYLINYLLTAYFNKKLSHPQNIREEYKE